MKFTALTIFLAVCFSSGVDSAARQLTLNGNAHIQFFGARDEIWNGLSNGKNFVIIHFLCNEQSRQHLRRFARARNVYKARFKNINFIRLYLETPQLCELWKLSYCTERSFSVCMNRGKRAITFTAKYAVVFSLIIHQKLPEERISKTRFQKTPCIRMHAKIQVHCFVV